MAYTFGTGSPNLGGATSPTYPADAGTVKQLPFQRTTTTTPNTAMIDPALQARMGYIQSGAPPDYSNYFNQLSQFAYDDARRKSAQISGAYGGNPTAQLGQGGGSQAALQQLAYSQLSEPLIKQQIDLENAWRMNQYNAGQAAYGDYFNALARAGTVDEGGFQSQIYNPSPANFPGGVYNPYAGSDFPKYGDSDTPQPTGGGGGGAPGAGGGGGGGGMGGGGGGGIDGPGTSSPSGGGSWFTDGPVTWPTYNTAPNEEPYTPDVGFNYSQPGATSYFGSLAGAGSPGDASGFSGFEEMINGVPMFATRQQAMAYQNATGNFAQARVI